MALTPQTRLGPYEILSPLGAGGMGEVYRARDARLNRDVALKVLPEIFSNDPERMARFEREAQVLASLNHPNIAALYGLEESGVTESGSVRALVMELVEGPTLAERITAAPMPLDEALPIARQIADALEYAHERGVIHRDLKPANIKLTHDGKVKVLDFGLAKALDADAASTDPSNSPTVSLAPTRAGVILGTAGYMSPEQAKGKPADKRADIWAFGVVLYEMLSGKPLYAGETAAETLAAVLMKDPTLDGLPADTPAAIRKLLRQCLVKDPRQRLQAIGDARIAIEEELSGAALDPVAGSAPGVAPVAVSPRRPRAWAAAVALLAVALAAVSVIHFREKPVAPELTQFQIQPPEHGSFGIAFALSPDGRQLAFPGTGPDGQSFLWVRPLSSLEPRLLSGTEGATLLPFWSPDSRFLVFAAGGKLKKTEATGGPPQVLCDAPAVVTGGSWSPTGVILFSSNFGGILKVSAAGGVATPATAVAPGETFHSHPFFLPDGRHFLYTRLAQRAENTGVWLGSVDAKPEDQRSKRLLNAGYAIYTASPDQGRGYLLFVRENTLMAQPVDPAKLELAGDPVPVADPVGQYVNRGLFSASASGVLAYRSGAGGVNRLTWFDRQGKALGHASDPGAYNTLALSPDATRVAAQRSDLQAANNDIWLIDLLRGAGTRFTFDPASESNPVWSPDGRRIVFGSNRDGVYNLYQKDSSGAGAEEALLKSTWNKFPHGWSRDGRFLIYTEVSTTTGYDLWVLPMTGERKPEPFLQTQFREDQAQFSPDGHWVAYESDASGSPEIYVRPFPAPQTNAGQWMISNGGGTQPRWRGDGKELFYFFGRRVMAVDVSTNPAFKAGVPKVLFEGPLFGGTTMSLHHWDVTDDGKRFLINTNAGDNNSTPITIVLNWTAGLKK